MIPWIYKKFGFPLMMLLIALTVFSGCPDTSGEGGARGTVTISLTDAEGDFVAYVVDVKSIILTRANGSAVETLPATTTIDFTRYVDVTRLISVVSVPLGAYAKATMVLDYSNADIRVENSAGAAVSVTSIIDADGNDVTELGIGIDLDNQNKLVVSAGLISRIVLDFDLKASHMVTFDEDRNAQLVVQPIVVADIDTDCPKIGKVRGLKMVVK